MDYKFGKIVSSDFIENKLLWDSKNTMKKMARKFGKIANVKIRQCYLCGNSKSEKECSFYGVNYVRCSKCSLVYADRRLSENQLEAFYEKDTDYDASASYANKKTLKIREGIVLPKIKFMKKYAKGKNWLDVGSADGSAISILHKEGFSPTGIELNESSRIFAKKYRKIELYPKSLSSFSKENKKKFDVISFFGVLDLVPNPMNELKISHKLLKNNGIVGMNVPNFDSVSTFVQKQIKEPARHLVPGPMLMQYNQRSLEYALKKSGFKPIATWYFGMDMIELLKFIRTRAKGFANSQVDGVLKDNLNDIQAIFDRNSLGDQIFMIGRKISK